MRKAPEACEIPRSARNASENLTAGARGVSSAVIIGLSVKVVCVNLKVGGEVILAHTK